MNELTKKLQQQLEAYVRTLEEHRTMLKGQEGEASEDSIQLGTQLLLNIIEPMKEEEWINHILDACIENDDIEALFVDKMLQMRPMTKYSFKNMSTRELGQEIT